MPDPTRDRLDVVLLGATGFTGSLAAERMAQLAAGRPDDVPLRWAVAGRSRERLQRVAERVGGHPGLVEVDLDDERSVGELVRGTRVLLNLAGPYTPTAERLVGACVRAGTHYADLSGELPLLLRVVERYHDEAARAGVGVVQLAGWEALAPDVAVLQAARAALEAGPGEWGPGAGGPVEQVRVVATVDPGPGAGSGAAVSSGTLRSIVETLTDPQAPQVVGDPAGLLPPSGAEAGVRRRSPIEFGVWRHRGQLVGPQVPVAVLNPPVLHRTAALLAERAGKPHRPARVREGLALGDARTLRAWRAVPGMLLLGAGQRAVVAATRLPAGARRRLGRWISGLLPPAGSGPEQQEGFSWTVRADVVTGDGRRGHAELTGTRHPGYGSTADMLLALGLQMASAEHQPGGCLTPAIALGAEIPEPLRTGRLRLTSWRG